MEEEGYTLLKYMEKKGDNQFIWGKLDLLKTSDEDILLEVDPPIPVTTHYLGLNQKDYKKMRNIVENMVYFLSPILFQPKYTSTFFQRKMFLPKSYWISNTQLSEVTLISNNQNEFFIEITFFCYQLILKNL